MKYTCDVCGRHFTTRAGCSRHEKACVLKPTLYKLVYDVVKDKVTAEEFGGEWIGYELDTPSPYGEKWYIITTSSTLSDEFKLKMLKAMTAYYDKHLDGVCDTLREYDNKRKHYTKQLALVSKRLKALENKEKQQ